MEVEPDTPLLWVLRDELGLTGTKFGCGIAQCGACTVLVDGAGDRAPARRRVEAVGDRTITTIEGARQTRRQPLQRPGSRYDVPQCGYCQSGQVMAATALLKAEPEARPRPISTRR